MATLTPVYGFRKPSNNDRVNVETDLNDNWDKADAHAHSGTYVAATIATGTGIDPTGSADSTTALQAKLTAAAGGMLFIPAGIYKVSATLDVPSNTTVLGYGATIDVLDNGTSAGRMFRLNGVSNVRILGLKLTVSNAAARTHFYGPLAVFNSTDVYLIDIEVASSAGVGIFTSQAVRLWITRPKVHNTYADGIHISRGSKDVHITDPLVYEVGDDAIAFVAVQSDTGGSYDQIQHVTLINPIVRDILGTLGSGIAIMGAKDVTVIGGNIDNLLSTSTSALKVSDDAVANTYVPADVNVVGTHARGCPVGFTIGNSTDVLFSGLSATGCAGSGATMIGATRGVIMSSKFRGNSGFGVYDDGTAGGGHVIGCDLRTNTLGATGGTPAGVSNCITASGIVIDGGGAS